MVITLVVKEYYYFVADIILKCYPKTDENDLTVSKINQKLSEVLKSSAVAKKLALTEHSDN